MRQAPRHPRKALVHKEADLVVRPMSPEKIHAILERRRRQQSTGRDADPTPIAAFSVYLPTTPELFRVWLSHQVRDWHKPFDWDAPEDWRARLTSPPLHIACGTYQWVIGAVFIELYGLDQDGEPLADDDGEPSLRQRTIDPAMTFEWFGAEPNSIDLEVRCYHPVALQHFQDLQKAVADRWPEARQGEETNSTPAEPLKRIPQRGGRRRTSVVPGPEDLQRDFETLWKRNETMEAGKDRTSPRPRMEEMASHYSVSLRQFHRRLSALKKAGTPWEPQAPSACR